MTIVEGGGSLIVADPSQDKSGVRMAGRESPVIPNWKPLDSSVYECHICLLPEDDGGYSVYIPLLPGVASQGDTEAEALANISEAFQGVVETYREGGESIPWLDPQEVEPPSASAKERWILVNV